MENRIYYLDCARALGIIGVVYGHVFGFENIISTWFFSFHVPLFFIISGVLVSEKRSTIIGILKKNAKKLIVPYLWFSIPFIMYEIYKMGMVGLETSISKTVCGYGMSALWFLPALFWGLSLFRIFLLVFIKISSKWLLYIICTVIFVLPFLIRTESVVGIVFLRVCTAVGFIGFGHFISLWINKRTINNMIGMLILIINLGATWVNGAVDLYELNYGNPVLYFIQATTGSVAILVFCKNICFKETLFSCIGRNTLTIMATHQMVIIVITQFVSDEKIVFLLTMVVEIPIVYVINKYFPFVLGKTKEQ